MNFDIEMFAAVDATGKICGNGESSLLYESLDFLRDEVEMLAASSTLSQPVKIVRCFLRENGTVEKVKSQASRRKSLKKRLSM